MGFRAVCTLSGGKGQPFRFYKLFFSFSQAKIAHDVRMKSSKGLFHPQKYEKRRRITMVHSN